MILFETSRLIVQRFRASDSDLFFAVNGDREVMHFIRPPKSRAESDRFLLENLLFYRDGSVQGRYAVFVKKDGSFIGTFSLLYLSGDNDFHIGYALLPAAWNQGYATELVRAGTPYFFRNTDKPVLFAITSPGNVASQQVLRKSGFAYKSRSLEDGKPIDTFYINRNLDTDAQIPKD